MGKQRRTGWYWPYLLLAPVILLLLCFSVGLLNGVLQSLGVIPAYDMTMPTLKYYQVIFTDPSLLASIRLSLYIAIVSAGLGTVLNVLLCWCIVTVYQGRGAAAAVSKLPMLVPATVAALIVITMVSPLGILPRILAAVGLEGLASVFDSILYLPNSIGIILAYIWQNGPFICFMTMSTMAGISGTLGEAAVNLGASPWQSFYRVTLPHCLPTIRNAFLIFFVYVFGSYELPYLLGATLPKALSVQAYLEYQNSSFLVHRPLAMALNTVMLLIALLGAALCYGWGLRSQRKRGIG